MEIGLFSLKFLNLFGRLLSQIFRLFAGFFRIVFGGLAAKILTKIYYGIFRLKQNGLTGKSIGSILRRRLIYLFIIIITGLSVGASLLSSTTSGATTMKISKTVMANLVPTEFGVLPDEDLIEETATPGNILTAGKEKYIDTSCTLDKNTGLIPAENLDQNNFLTFNDGGDMIFKPMITSTGGASSSGSNNAFIPQRTEIVYYTVGIGDTISTIAHKFGLTTNTILWANNLSSLSLIRPGDTLTILPYSGVLYTVKAGDTVAKIADKYGVDSDKILSCNTLGNSLKAGQKIVVPGARKISETVAISKPVPETTTNSNANSNYTSGLSVIRDFIKAPSASTSGGSKMCWPTVGHTITQYFSWHHPAIDIANHIGTPVYAADAGTVIFAGWATGYGNSIVIDHGNGIKTRYGHASKLFVSVGDTVQKCENIMAMGSTGWSTGPHVHFEVMVNNVKYNPLNYVR